MRHNRQTHRLGRDSSERKALLENLVTSLLKHQEIKTTLQKAKAAQRLADHVITLGKTDTLHSRRQVFSFIQDHELTSKLFKEVAPRFKSRKGGYTRIMQINHRKGDGAQLAILELTEKEIIVKEPKKSKKKDTKPEKEIHLPEADHETHEEHSKGSDKEIHFTKRPEPKKEKQKPSFFKNLGKFFRNKGGS
ncbi:MAG: 50S ribosomal protein L17 [Candidatus Omnitrophica bacterium CG1_02_46_14]|nr:MAG: 50S ribosomal protein L17 [Candidatus Omnitrophica bacterium CG1_02_46_14]